MPIKTELGSPTPGDSSDPFTPPKQKRKANKTSPTPSNSSSDKKILSASAKKPKSTPTGSMTPAIKEALIDHMMRIACSAVNKEKLANELGISKKQLDNAICSGRVNLRSKLVKAAREL